MITFRKKGMLTTIQDLGRIGYQRYGMPVCGAMDRYAMELANILVGNPRSEAVIEATVMGPSIVFGEPEIFAVTGGDFGPTLNGASIESNRAHLAEAGDVLALSMAKAGARAYIAFAGGLDIEEVMGSRSTFLKGGVGGLDGRAVRDGDEIGLKAPCDSLPDLEERFVPEKLRRPSRPVSMPSATRATAWAFGWTARRWSGPPAAMGTSSPTASALAPSRSPTASPSS